MRNPFLVLKITVLYYKSLKVWIYILFPSNLTKIVFQALSFQTVFVSPFFSLVFVSPLFSLFWYLDLFLRLYCLNFVLMVSNIEWHTSVICICVNFCSIVFFPFLLSNYSIFFHNFFHKIDLPCPLFQISCHTQSGFFLSRQSVIVTTSKSPRKTLRKLLTGKTLPRSKLRSHSSLHVCYCRFVLQSQSYFARLLFAILLLQVYNCYYLVRILLVCLLWLTLLACGMLWTSLAVILIRSIPWCVLFCCFYLDCLRI